MNKETVARQQITIADVRDGEKGAKGDTGTAAEFYHLQPMEETALVGVDNVLRVKLAYTIEHVKGTQVTTEAGSAQGYHVTARMNNGVTIAMTNGAMNSGAYKITSYSKAQNRPGYVIIELKDKANKVVDTRTVQIIMESASYVDVVGDLRTTVSQQGKNITTINQTADSISLKVDGIKNGVKNLLKGGKYEKTFSSYGFTKEAKVIKLKPQTTYTLTMCGRVSADAITKKQTLQGYVVSDGWRFSAGGGNLEINTPADSVVSFTFTTPTSDKLPNDGLCFFDAYPTPNKEPQARNADVTVNWVTVTEGTQAAASWIPAEGEDVYTQMSKAGMEIKDGEITLTADRTKIRNNKGEDIAVFNEDGTVDARRILMRCRFGNITFGEVDGYPNIILTNELGQPQIMLNHRGIVNKYGVDMELINASRYFVNKRDGKAYLGVNIIVRITNRGFQQNTYGGGDIKLTATLDDKSHESITLQLGQQYTDDNKAIIAATTPITLKIGESGEMIYGGLFEIGSTSGGAVVAQKISYSVRSVYYDTVVAKSYVSELGGNNFSSDSGGNLINPSNGDEPPAVIPAPNMDV